ncbi:MAG TPA: SDR family oxidoreductase [Chitinophagaceae bacterium]|jgi:NAD(P)-dependent dehydrogenase (short-subunit alcohol dehydrogenase family)|nr:SDR family oxidoreductase [Chitinophagaceae bacterium]
MKNIFIVGGSSGIGKQLVQQLEQDNYRVFATYYKQSPASTNSSSSYHYCNVLDESIDTAYLPETLHGLVYCPGSIQLKPFARIKPGEFEQDFRLQVSGAVKIIQAVLPKLKASGDASVILFSTVAVQAGLSFHTQVAASKGAIEGLTKALAAELAPTIRVNAIAPSLTDTPLAANLLNTEEKRTASAQRHPLKKIGSPADIANMAAFLLSEKAGWITGQVMHVDGGLSSLK